MIGVFIVTAVKGICAGIGIRCLAAIWSVEILVMCISVCVYHYIDRDDGGSCFVVCFFACKP